MITIVTVEIVCAVFLCILLVGQMIEGSRSKSSRMLNLCILLVLFSLVVDAMAYSFVDASTPFVFRYIVCILAYAGEGIYFLGFAYYSEEFFAEKTEVNPWIFRILRIAEAVWIAATVIVFATGNIIVYENGVEVTDYGYPLFLSVYQMVVMLYTPVVAYIYRKKIGKEAVVLLSLFNIAPILGIVSEMIFSFDYSYVLGAAVLVFIAEVLQRKQVQAQQAALAMHEGVARNNQRVLALADDFESLYDVELESGHYVSYDRDEFYTRNLSSKFVSPTEFFEDLRTNIDTVVYEEDRNGLFDILHREAIIRELAESDHIDYYYRVLTENGPMWLKMRIVYKDADKKHVIIGIFNAEGDVEAKQLAEQRKQLQGALETANTEAKRNDLVISIVNAGRFIYKLNAEDEVTDAFYTDVSKKRIGTEYLEKMKWLELLHPDDKENVYSKFTACIHDHTGETPYDVTFRMLGVDGKYRWVRSGGNVVRHTDGSGEFYGISLDITDQMEEQQKRLLGAVALSPDVLSKANIGLWAFELDEGQAPRMYADETMLRLLGLEHQVAPEEIYHAWYDHIDEGSYDLVTDAVEKMTAGEHAEVQYPWHHPDGHIMIVRCGGVSNPQYTKGIRIEGTHQDVSQTVHFDEEVRERAKRVEEELVISKLRADSLAYIEDNNPDLDKGLNFFGRRILEITGCDQVVYREPDGHRVVINAPGVEDVPAGICASCPFAKVDRELFGDDGIVLMNDCSSGYCGVYPPADCPAKSSFMQLIYSGGELVGKLTIHFLKDYHSFTENILSTMKIVAVYLGLLIGRIQTKQAEIARIEAESSKKAKTEFLFSMSHDIRTPMNAILGYTEIGLRHVDDVSRSKDSYNKIKAAGGHLLNLINDILEMSRIESGKLELTEQPADIRTASKNIRYMSEALAAPKNIRFTMEIGELKNPYLYMDDLHISEIIINLVSNAVKYTPEGGQVKYSVNQISGVLGGMVTYRFEVTDNGIGMSEEFQRHLFEAFSREQTSTVSKIEGTGLGLSIVKRIVDMTGGSIRVKSKQKEGSTFTVEIPFRAMDDASIQKYESDLAAEHEIINHISLEGRKVLLVEDNEMNREIAADILTEAGLIIETAEDGEMAVKAVLDKGIRYYDYILMDIQMPVMNGYEATKAIRALPAGDSIPIIALSANAFEEDKQRSLEGGMNAHIAKPIDVKELFDAMQQLANIMP